MLISSAVWFVNHLNDKKNKTKHPQWAGQMKMPVLTIDTTAVAIEASAVVVAGAVMVGVVVVVIVVIKVVLVV